MTEARFLIVVVAVALLAAGRVEAPSHMAAPGAEDDAPALDAAAATFPLSVAPDQRHLQDAKGKPFLIPGEAAWSLIAQLTREQAETYLDDRRRRGFNTLPVRLLAHPFPPQPPPNA